MGIYIPETRVLDTSHTMGLRQVEQGFSSFFAKFLQKNEENLVMEIYE